MIYTEEVFELEDEIDKLCDTLIQSELVKGFWEAKYQLKNNNETRIKEKEFVFAKESFEKIEAYGSYAPDYKEKRRALREKKRQLDLDETVASFKVKERELQDVLDTTVFDLAKSISPNIKIEAGNPFFEFAQKGCSGNCHVG